MNMSKFAFKHLALAALAAVSVAAMVQPTAAAGVGVYVGYSDGLRGAGFFPSPWSGDPGVTFEGSGPPFDAGAIMILNGGASSITVNGITVSINGTAVAPPWTFPVTLAAGNKLIVTQTTQYDFDTSDIHPISPNGVPVTGCAIACPTVTVNVMGVGPVTYDDSGHVLDTNGYDFAYNGSNESFRWRLIGTSGIPSGVPEPSTWAMMLLGFAGIGFGGYRKAKSGRTAFSAA
jgi:hypothetical protein